MLFSKTHSPSFPIPKKPIFGALFQNRLVWHPPNRHCFGKSITFERSARSGFTGLLSGGILPDQLIHFERKEKSYIVEWHCLFCFSSIPSKTGLPSPNLPKHSVVKEEQTASRSDQKDELQLPIPVFIRPYALFSFFHCQVGFFKERSNSRFPIGAFRLQNALIVFIKHWATATAPRNRRGKIFLTEYVYWSLANRGVACAKIV